MRTFSTVIKNRFSAHFGIAMSGVHKAVDGPIDSIPSDFTRYSPTAERRQIGKPHISDQPR